MRLIDKGIFEEDKKENNVMEKLISTKIFYGNIHQY